jgi:hypothetical protein
METLEPGAQAPLILRERVYAPFIFKPDGDPNTLVVRCFHKDDSEFFYSEEIAFTGEKAWSETTIIDRAVGIMKRAVFRADSENRLGYDLVDQGSGKSAIEVLHGLPAFDDRAILRVTVEIVMPID